MNDILHTLISLLEAQEEIKITYKEVQNDVRNLHEDTMRFTLS